MKRIYFIVLLNSVIVTTSIAQQQALTGYHNISNQLREFYGNEQNIDMSEGGGYMDYVRWQTFWKQRLKNGQEYEDYFKALELTEEFCSYETIDNTWYDVGPNGMFDGPVRQRGIGPIEFVSIFRTDPDYMLCGSVHGGLFFSDDEGENWTNFHTDDNENWKNSACSWADFHPNDKTVIFAVSSASPFYGPDNGPGPLRKYGGIFRFDASIGNWVKIADSDDIGGDYSSVYKFIVIPNSSTGINESDEMFVATDRGLFKGTGVSTGTPSWSQVNLSDFFPSDNWNNQGYGVYDIEVKTDDADVIVISAMQIDRNNSATPEDGINWGKWRINLWQNWKYLISENGGDDWELLIDNPATNNQNGQTQSTKWLTLEMSAGHPDNLYLLTTNIETGVFGGDGSVYSVNLLANPRVLNIIISSTPNVEHGEGHGFALSQSVADEIILHARRTNYVEIQNSNTPSLSGMSVPHDDVEGLEFHPTNDDIMWMCNHGGLYKSIDGGDNWLNKNKGLGVATVTNMATSYKNPRNIFLALFHDYTWLSHTEYTGLGNWNTNWMNVGSTCCDGLRSLIDNNDPGIMFASDQSAGWYVSADGENQPFSNPSESDFDSDWGGEAILNKTDENIIFLQRNGSIFSRTYDKNSAGTALVFGNSQTLWDVNQTVDWARGVYNNFSNGNYLYTQVSTANGYSLFVNRDVQNSTTPIWTELPIPSTTINTSLYSNILNQEFDAKVDPENSDIIYLSYNTPNINSIDACDNGGNVFFKLNYKDYPNSSIILENLSSNLPPTLAGTKCIEVEQGSDGAVYFSTDYGTFYRNNKFPEWRKFGIGKPHIAQSGLEINYKANVIRASTWGRGVWETSLVCPEDYDLSLPYSGDYYGGNMFYEAINNIESNEMIQGSQITFSQQVVYRAGNEIHLTDGFHAEAGSDFHAFIHGCNTTGSSFKTDEDMGEESFYVFEEDDEGNRENIEHKYYERGMKIIPNPNTGLFNLLLLSSEQGTKLSITNITGQNILHTNITNQKTSLDLSQYARGIYVVNITYSDGETDWEKVIIE